MQCAAHPEIEARGPCAVCSKNLCDACAVYELGASGSRALCCEPCGRSRADESVALSSGLLALVGVGYLATLAIGVTVFGVRSFVAGLAAMVAIALGRAMQMLIQSPRVTRRLGARPRAVDATSPHL